MKDIEEEYRLAKRLVFRRLALRSYATQELRQLLHEKKISEEVIDKIIQECIELGYCNDAQWVTDFIRIHRARKQGPRNILMKLKTKGISEELLEQAAEQLQDQSSQQDALQKLLTTRYCTHNLTEFHERQKVIAALMQRGFSLDSIKEAIAKIQK